MNYFPKKIGLGATFFRSRKVTDFSCLDLLLESVVAKDVRCCQMASSRKVTKAEASEIRGSLSPIFFEEDRSTIILANHLLLVGFRGIPNIIFSVLNLRTFLAAAVEAEEAEEVVPLNRQQFIPIHFRPLF